MSVNFVPLDKEKHKNIKLAVSDKFEYAKETHLASASIREFAGLAANMPIVFIQDPTSQRYHVVAMLGIEQGQNLFLLGDRWAGSHVPMNIVRYPFDVRAEGERLSVYIDENSSLIADEGIALFTEAGEATDYLKNRQQFLADLTNSEMLTQRFIKEVVDSELLDNIQVMVTHRDGKQRNITGMMAINEKKLTELSDEKIVQLHKSGFLGAMYATMMSLSQMNRLIELSATLENPISTMRLSVVAPEQAPASA